MSKVRFFLIGCGRIGKRHAEYMHLFGELVAVCDIVRDSADTLALQFGAAAYYKIGDLLQNEKVDGGVAAVCTPNGLHALHSIECLNAGLHVLCEKPMALKVTDCIDMMAAAKRAGKNLFVVKQNRFNPPVKAVKSIIDKQLLGKIYSIQVNCFWNRNNDYYLDTWKGSLDLDGGTLFTQFSHFVDIMYWLVGDIRKATSILANHGHKGVIEIEDTGVAILIFENGATGTLHYTVNSYGENMEGSITIFAEKGTVKIGGQYLNKIDFINIENHTMDSLPPAKTANNYGQYQGSMSNHDEVYKNLVGFLEGKEDLYMNTADAMKTVEIIETIYRSAVTL